MGCFNTQGFISKLDIEDRDEIFLLICAPFSKPIEWIELNEGHDHHVYSGKCNQPISLPIFGRYDAYGSIENIKHDFNTDKLEKLFGDKIETVVDILYRATVFPSYMEKEEIDKYNHYKDRLGIYLTDEKIMEDFTRQNLKRIRNNPDYKPISFDEYKDVVVKGSNQELTWTIGHKFVYDTMSSLCDVPDNDTYFSRFIDKTFGQEKEEVQEDILKFQRFEKCLRRLNLSINSSSCTSQEFDWEKSLLFINSIKDFIIKKN